MSRHPSEPIIYRGDDPQEYIDQLEARLSEARALAPHIRTAALTDDWETFDSLLRELAGTTHE